MDQIARWDYAGEGLEESQLPGAPWDLVRAWVDAAHARSLAGTDLPEPDQISVGTVDADGRPGVRTVLMRYLQPAGPGFYTNLDSRKARDLAANPRIAATLTWAPMFRAIRFTGTARELDRDTVRAYFESRPWGSRIGAWASAQSQPIHDRTLLEERVRELELRWPDTGRADDVPLPDGWGGYVVECDEVEFWAGRSSRLHDRLVFVREGDGDLATEGAWRVERRQP